MKVITKNGEELIVKEIHVVNNEDLPGILFPNQVQRFNFEKSDYSGGLHEYEIERLGNISLGFKTYINKTASDTDLEICQWDDYFKTRWTIASFEPIYDNGLIESYELQSCGDRLNTDKINWRHFGILVKHGYKWLKDHTNNDEED